MVFWLKSSSSNRKWWRWSKFLSAFRIMSSGSEVGMFLSTTLPALDLYFFTDSTQTLLNPRIWEVSNSHSESKYRVDGVRLTVDDGRLLTGFANVVKTWKGILIIGILSFLGCFWGSEAGSNFFRLSNWESWLIDLTLEVVRLLMPGTFFDFRKLLPPYDWRLTSSEKIEVFDSLLDPTMKVMIQYESLETFRFFYDTKENSCSSSPLIK